MDSYPAIHPIWSVIRITFRLISSYTPEERFLILSFFKLMKIKEFTALPVLSLTIGLVFSFTPAASAEYDNFGNTKWVERRVHCTWKNGKFGLKYKSCSPQQRSCKQFIGYNGVPAKPQTCSDWG
jgi:hypothetical protein